MMPVLHKPAFVNEILEYIGNPAGQRILVPCIGPGGHAKLLLERGAEVIGIDLDNTAIEMGRRNLAGFEDRLLLIHGNMADAEELLAEQGIESVDACLIDAGGLSMDQMLDEDRGFSAHSESSLDMRIDRSKPGPTASELINELLDMQQLTRVLSAVVNEGKRREARRVAKRIIAARERRPIQTTAELADIIAAALGRSRPPRRIDAAVYLMAIRIEVNDELNSLRAGIEASVRLLSPTGNDARTGTGTLVAITWHGVEHALCKRTLRRLANPCTCPPGLPICRCGKEPAIEILTPKPLFPSEQEVHENPSVRSARLHATRKLPEHQEAPGR